MPSAGHCEVRREVCEEGEVYVRKLNRFSDATCNRQVGDSFLFWSIVAIVRVLIQANTFRQSVMDASPRISRVGDFAYFQMSVWDALRYIEPRTMKVIS